MTAAHASRVTDGVRFMFRGHYVAHGLAPAEPCGDSSKGMSVGGATLITTLNFLFCGCTTPVRAGEVLSTRSGPVTSRGFKKFRTSSNLCSPYALGPCSDRSDCLFPGPPWSRGKTVAILATSCVGDRTSCKQQAVSGPSINPASPCIKLATRPSARSFPTL